MLTAGTAGSTAIAQMAAATTALEEMASNAQNGGFDSIMLPVLQQQGMLVGVDTSTLATGGGWQQATITSSQTSVAPTKPSPSGSMIAGFVVGPILCVGLIAGLAYLGFLHRTPGAIVGTAASETASTDTVVDARPKANVETPPSNVSAADEAARVHNAAITDGVARLPDDLENDGASQHLPTA
jgi:hypothetical protein